MGPWASQSVRIDGEAGGVFEVVLSLLCASQEEHGLAIIRSGQEVSEGISPIDGEFPIRVQFLPDGLQKGYRRST